MSTVCSLLPLVTLAVGAVLFAISSARIADWISRVGAVVIGVVALATAATAVLSPGVVVADQWWLLDARGGLFLGVVAVIGTISALMSPGYLPTARAGANRTRSHGPYYVALYAFWAIMIAIPITANLGVAWMLIEASTAASAVLVAYSGTSSALEAGWKYLVLTTAGLTIALLGILVLYVSIAHGHGSIGTLNWSALASAQATLPHHTAVLIVVLVVGGLAAKIGWAPVHHWLPDAHSEAPPPVSAMLSAALLPTVMLIAWRFGSVMEPSSGTTFSRLFIGFGMASLAMSVPFLWRPMAWKRLLAYSSLEHIGVIALGIGFGNEVAIAGVVLHVTGHALAKGLGFYSATALFALDGTARHRRLRGLADRSPVLAATVGVSLGSLTGLPPAPLFFSEVLIILGGIDAGYSVVAGLAAVLLALGFLGLIAALIEALAGKPRAAGPAGLHTFRGITALTTILGALLLSISALATSLPGSAVIRAIAERRS